MRKTDNSLLNCRLCPRNCGVNRAAGELGFCRAGKSVKIARAALHFWEEPCISGKDGSGAVFFSHCSMKCVYCQNYEISEENNGRELSEEELAEKFIHLQELGANNINLVTPTHFVPHIISALDIAKKSGLNLPVLYNCGGYESIDTLRMLEGYVDIYMPDIKYFSDRYAMKYSSAQNYFVVAKSALAEMFRQVGRPMLDAWGIMKKGIIVRHMMLPGLLFDTKRIIDFVCSEYGDGVYFSLMSQYTPVRRLEKFPELTHRINLKHYEAMADYCREKGMKNVFLQEWDSASRDFIPEFEY